MIKDGTVDFFKDFDLLGVQLYLKGTRNMARLLHAAVLTVVFLCSSVLSQPDTCYETTDILFVLDSSGSVQLENFQKQLQFAATFINRFVVGQARFSVIRFDSSASILFGFDKYTDSSALKNAILSIDYPAGGTDTAAALRLARQAAFNATNGARTGVPKIVIVCTDGQSNDPNATAIEAQNLKNANVLILSIGIGTSINKKELETIATYPEDVFVVIDYNQLLSIVYDYSELICKAVKLFRCNNQADIYFLLDASSNVGEESFKKELQYVGNFSNNFDLTNVFIGAATFGGFGFQKVFNLGQFRDQFQLEQVLTTAVFPGGITETDSALKSVSSQRVFDAAYGGRPNATKILIILTDGHSVSASQAQKTAAELRASGVNIIAVGVSRPNITELKTLGGHDVLDVVSNLLLPRVLVDRVQTLTAVRECELPSGPSTVPSGPSTELSNICRENLWESGIHPHPYNCSQYIACTSLKTDILSCPGVEIYDPDIQTCNYPGLVKNPCKIHPNLSPRPSPKPISTLVTAPCRKGLLDILLILDSSDNVGVNGFGNELKFAANLAENFHLGPDAIQFAAATFSSSVVDLFNFDRYGNYTPLQRAILSANYLGGAANTNLALKQGATLFDQAHGARAGVPKVAVLFTSGRPSNAQATRDEATALKNAGVYVIAVGFSNPVLADLQAIASSPNDVYLAEEFDKVLTALVRYSNTTCANLETITCRGIQFADVIFVVDSSNSISSPDYVKQLTFVADVTNSFTLGPEDVRFGAIIFSTDTVKLFDLKDFDQPAQIRSALLSAQHLQSGTDTAKAINFINYQRMFSAGSGGRDNATKIVIVLTDGRSNSITDTVSAAQRLKATGVKFISIGVGDLIFEDELRQLASDNQTVFFVANFQALDEIRTSVTKQVCYGSKTPENVPDYTYLCAAHSWADGLHPNPLDCSTYVECYSSTTYVRTCPAGQAFDPTPNFFSCRTKALAHPCNDPIYFGPTAATAAPQNPVSTRGPSVVNTTSLCADFKLNDGIYPDPGNCEYFVECTAQITQRLQCPEGLFFNTANDVCDDVHVVDCQNNYEFFLHYG